MQTKIVIFVEGQSEQIFLRSMLSCLYDYNLLSFKCLRLYARKYKNVPYLYGDAANSKIHLGAVTFVRHKFH